MRYTAHPGGEATVRPGSVRADSADVYINTRCNFACETCFLGDDYFAQDLAMTAAEVGAIGRWLAEAGVRDVAVLGGEPTLHPDLLRIMGALREAGIESLRLITNGTPRARHLLSGELDGLVDLTYVSLDGASAAVNDAVRGKDTYRHAVAAIELLHSRQMPFVITSTLSRPAISELDELLAFAEASGCEVLNLHWLSAVGRARFRDLAVAPEEWDEVVERVAAYEPRRPGLTVECQVGSLVPGATWTAEVDPRACAVRDRSNLEFMPDGKVFSCGLLVDTPRLAAYRWDGEQLLERQPPNELSVCSDFGEDGCPARQVFMNESFSGGRLPVCIYERVVRRGSS